MGTLLGAILAVETVALLLFFPKFKQRMLQRKEVQEHLLRSFYPPTPVPSRRPPVRFSNGESRSQLLVARDTSLTANTPKQNPDEVIMAIKNHIGLDTREEAGAIYGEAQNGSRVAQFIVGMALLKSGRPGARDWLRLSAEQDFGPAQDHMEEAG